MPFDVTLLPGDLFVSALELDYPDDGNPGRARATIPGDARDRASETGITLILNGVTYGPFRGIGDYDWRPRENLTTLYLGEQRPELDPAGTVSAVTVSGILAELFPGIILTALPAVLAGARVKGLETEGRDRREIAGDLIGSLGFRVIQQDGTFTVDAPAREDVFGDGFTHDGEKGDQSAVPRTIILQGGESHVLPEVTGAMGPGVSASVQSGDVLLTWADLLGETVGRVKSWTVTHQPEGGAWADLGSVTPDGSGHYGYVHESPGPGLHTYALVSMVATGDEKGYAVRRSTPGLPVTVRTDGERGTVSLQPGARNLSLTLPGEAPLTRVTITGPGGSASADLTGSVEVGTGKALSFTLQPSTTYTLSFTDPSTGAVTYAPLTVTTRALPTLQLAATPDGHSAVITWNGEGPHMLRVTGPSGTVFESLVSGGQATVTALQSETEHTARLWPLGDETLAQSKTFTTLAADLMFNEEELFAASRNATITQPAAVAGGTSTVTRIRKDGQLVRTKTRTVVTVPLIDTDALTGVQSTRQEEVITTSDTVHEYGFVDFRNVETGSTTLTTNTTSKGVTSSRTRITKQWNPRGWLNVLTREQELTEQLSGGPARVTLKVIETSTWARNGVDGWSMTRSVTGKTLTPQYDGDGELVTWVEQPINDPHPTATAQAPEFAPEPEDPDAPLELGVQLPPGTPVWDQPQVDEPEPEEGATVEDEGPTRTLSAMRQTGATGGVLTVSLPWSTDQRLLEWAADFLLDTVGRRQVTVGRTYPTFWPVRRGGAVRALQIAFTATPRGQVLFTQKVTTRFTPRFTP